MERWSGKVAVVTGASSGIGAIISQSLVSKSVKVIGLARRIEKMEKLAAKLGKDNFYPIQCDMRKEEEILKAFEIAIKMHGGVDILINNAGAVTNKPIIDSDTESYREIIDTNLIAPAICAREAIRSMRTRNAPGHVININSIAGQYAETLCIPLGMYGASKYGLRALGTELRHEVVLNNLNVKITNISPGAVHTEMYTRFVSEKTQDKLPILTDKDVADATLYALGTPEGVEIPEITIVPQKEVIGLPLHARMAFQGKSDGKQK